MRVAPRGLAAGTTELQLTGEFNIPPLSRIPQPAALTFGGISGIARGSADGTILLGISDGHPGSRVYRLRVSGEGPSFRVDPVETIYLQYTGGPQVDLDPEAIAVLPDGDLLIGSEGLSDSEPRLPPAIVRYGPHGEFRGTLDVPERYVPERTGPVTHGVRRNAAFESLTMSPSGDRLFTGTESALLQDGEAANFDHGATSRIIEYTRSASTFKPRREFAYEVEAMHRPPFEPGFSIIGLVELLAFGNEDLLAMEREYVENKGNKAGSFNRIRVFRISISGATDISAIDSLKEARSVVPVKKTLLLDLGEVKGLSPQLGTLENFEGMTFGPRLADGRASLVLVSDDNFDRTQRTSFLMFGIGRY